MTPNCDVLLSARVVFLAGEVSCWWWLNLPVPAHTETPVFMLRASPGEDPSGVSQSVLDALRPAELPHAISHHAEVAGRGAQCLKLGKVTSSSSSAVKNLPLTAKVGKPRAYVSFPKSPTRTSSHS